MFSWYKLMKANLCYKRNINEIYIVNETLFSCLIVWNASQSENMRIGWNGLSRIDPWFGPESLIHHYNVRQMVKNCSSYKSDGCSVFDWLSLTPSPSRITTSRGGRRRGGWRRIAPGWHLQIEQHLVVSMFGYRPVPQVRWLLATISPRRSYMFSVLHVLACRRRFYCRGTAPPLRQPLRGVWRVFGAISLGNRRRVDFFYLGQLFCDVILQ